MSIIRITPIRCLRKGRLYPSLSWRNGSFALTLTLSPGERGHLVGLDCLHKVCVHAVLVAQ